LGTRNIAKEELVKWKTENPSAQVGSFESAAKFGEVILLAVNGEGAEEAIKLAGTENLTNKVVIDATNPISHAKPPVNGVLQYFTTKTCTLCTFCKSI
jgi:8-hydroxy-5-deazaflavin:NADPH oxidoreductase